MKLDIPTDELTQPLALREKLAIYLLLLILAMLLRPKYSHQWEEVIKPIIAAMKLGT